MNCTNCKVIQVAQSYKREQGRDREGTHAQHDAAAQLELEVQEWIDAGWRPLTLTGTPELLICMLVK